MPERNYASLFAGDAMLSACRPTGVRSSDARSDGSHHAHEGARVNSGLDDPRNPEARRFYEGEALRGGWTVRQLDRQIGSQFYERLALSKNKAALLRKGQQQTPDDVMTPEEEIKDPMPMPGL